MVTTGPFHNGQLAVKYNLNPEFYVQAGVYEYNPENLKRSKGFNLSTDGSKGAIILLKWYGLQK